jgi:hypothetical protein
MFLFRAAQMPLRDKAAPSFQSTETSTMREWLSSRPLQHNCNAHSQEIEATRVLKKAAGAVTNNQRSSYYYQQTATLALATTFLHFHLIKK